MSAELPMLERPAQGTAQGLVVLLHGVGSNEQSLAGLAQALDSRLHVLLPRGPLVFGPQAFGWFTVRFGAQRIDAGIDAGMLAMDIYRFDGSAAAVAA